MQKRTIKTICTIAAVVIFAAIVYGEYDASNVIPLPDVKLKGGLRVRDDASYDFLENHPKLPRGQVIVEIFWTTPDDGSRINKITTSGTITPVGGAPYSFSDDCARGSTDLTNHNNSFDMNCFVVTDARIPISDTALVGSLDYDAAITNLRASDFNFYASAWGKRPPLAYVSWINKGYSYLFGRRW